jgi:hypothetical protein
MTWEKIDEMRARYAAGESISALSRAFSMFPSAGWRICKGVTWQEKWRYLDCEAAP